MESDTKCQSSSMAALCRVLDGEMESIQRTGSRVREHAITGKQATIVQIEGSKNNHLNFCSNNYLDLASHPDVIQAGKTALDTHGSGLGSSRFICGTQNLHTDLERRLAKFHGREDAVLYSSCYEANMGLFQSLLSAEDAVLSDELNHASIIDGIRLCKAKRLRYKHRDMADLQARLEESRGCRLRLIVSEGVFSMDGNITPLREISRLAREYDALVFLDECHATGIVGDSGRGTEEHFGLTDQVDIINSSLGKALGGAAGGYTVGPRRLTELLRLTSRPYLFSTSLPPSVAASTSKALDILMSPCQLLQRLGTNAEHFRERMTAAGFTIAGDAGQPICPVMLGDAHLTSTFAEKMLEQGIFVIGFSFPVVPKGAARIRVQLSSSHSTPDVDAAVDAFIKIGRELKVII